MSASIRPRQVKHHVAEVSREGPNTPGLSCPCGLYIYYWACGHVYKTERDSGLSLKATPKTHYVRDENLSFCGPTKPLPTVDAGAPYEEAVIRATRSGVDGNDKIWQLVVLVESQATNPFLCHGPLAFAPPPIRVRLIVGPLHIHLWQPNFGPTLVEDVAEVPSGPKSLYGQSGIPLESRLSRSLCTVSLISRPLHPRVVTIPKSLYGQLISLNPSFPLLIHLVVHLIMPPPPKALAKAPSKAIAKFAAQSLGGRSIRSDGKISDTPKTPAPDTKPRPKTPVGSKTPVPGGWQDDDADHVDSSILAQEQVNSQLADD
ncbi:hypothetical protein F5Y18DRAFT_426579 [Xylariaceae sp. FL1019]|nr:hypothetical protein F5Y18DRAFT_426579 [Xylariaceae sp. FL1019]